MKKKRRIVLCGIMTFIMVFAMAIPMSVSAANENVAAIGENEYATLEEAIEKAKDGDTITLLTDTEAGGIRLDKSLTFDLGENTIKGLDTKSYVFSPWAVNTVFKNGTIEVTRQTPGSMGIQAVGGNLTLDGVEIKVIVPNGTNDYNYGIKAFASADADGDGTIDDPVKVTMNNSVITEVENSDAGENYGASGVIVIGKHKNDTVNDNLDNRDAALEINGSTITVSAFAVSGNGAAHGTKIDINNSTLTSEKATAIYHPQIGEMNISGGTITGETGIEVRAGTVTVSDGAKIIATGYPTTVGANGNGTTTIGAALAVAQHTTELPITVNIENGNLSGASALVTNNPQENDQEAISKVKVNIENGQFEGLVNDKGGGKIEAAGGTFDNLGAEVDVVASDVAEITQGEITKTVIGLANINEAIKNAPEGTIVEFIKAAEKAEVEAPAGVTVENNTGVAISVNGEPLGDGETVTVTAPETPPADQPSDKPQQGEPADGKAPETGDHMNLGLLAGIMLTAAAAGAAAVALRRKGSKA